MIQCLTDELLHGRDYYSVIYNLTEIIAEGYFSLNNVACFTHILVPYQVLVTVLLYVLVAVGAETFGVYFVDAQNEVKVHAFVSIHA